LLAALSFFHGPTSSGILVHWARATIHFSGSTCIELPMRPRYSAHAAIVLLLQHPAGRVHCNHRCANGRFTRESLRSTRRPPASAGVRTPLLPRKSVSRFYFPPCRLFCSHAGALETVDVGMDPARSFHSCRYGAVQVRCDHAAAFRLSVGCRSASGSAGSQCGGECVAVSIAAGSLHCSSWPDGSATRRCMGRKITLV